MRQFVQMNRVYENSSVFLMGNGKLQETVL